MLTPKELLKLAHEIFPKGNLIKKNEIPEFIKNKEAYEIAPLVNSIIYKEFFISFIDHFKYIFIYDTVRCRKMFNGIEFTSDNDSGKGSFNSFEEAIEFIDKNEILLIKMKFNKKELTK